jgi:SAM-dependent methyltransferase
VETKNFETHYIEWREKRIAKIEKIFGVDFFKNKSILEVACGYGHIGNHFSKLGANVEFTEGREEHLPFIREKNPNSKVHHVNHDQLWNLNRRYDLVIHFGLLYHLTNWQQDLECAFLHSDLIILESEILDSLKPMNFYEARDGGGYDQALSTSKFAIRPTSDYVESVITKNNYSFVRYDDEDLDTPVHKYSWKVKGIHDRNGGYIGYGPTRRFWVVRKNV